MCNKKITLHKKNEKEKARLLREMGSVYVCPCLCVRRATLEALWGCLCAAGAGVLTVPGSLSAPEGTKKRTDMPVQTQRQEQK